MFAVSAILSPLLLSESSCAWNAALSLFELLDGPWETLLLYWFCTECSQKPRPNPTTTAAAALMPSVLAMVQRLSACSADMGLSAGTTGCASAAPTDTTSSSSPATETGLDRLL